MACNTATAAAINTLRAEYSDRESSDVRERVLRLSGGRQDHIMFIGMEPAVKAAAKLTRSGVVGVLATAGTLHGEKYISTRDHYTAGVTVVEHVGEGFVELVESGDTDGSMAESVVSLSVRPLLDAGADIIVLGCTHYPFLSDTIRKVASGIAPDREIRILDPAPAVARHLLDVMEEEGLYGCPSDAEGGQTGSGTEDGQAGGGTGHTDSTAGGSVRLLASGPTDTLLNLYSAL